MKLANLLAAGVARGKVFFSGHDTPTYRASRRAYVPQFNNGKNPFTPRAATDKKVEPTAPVAPVKRPTRATRVTKWADKLNPFRAAEPVRPVRRAVQSELSLQTVTVVQNDYSESDIERVPAKSCTLPPEPVQPAARRWEILANAS